MTTAAAPITTAAEARQIARQMGRRYYNWTRPAEAHMVEVYVEGEALVMFALTGNPSFYAARRDNARQGLLRQFGWTSERIMRLRAQAGLSHR